MPAPRDTPSTPPAVWRRKRLRDSGKRKGTSGGVDSPCIPQIIWSSSGTSIRRIRNLDAPQIGDRPHFVEAEKEAGKGVCPHFRKKGSVPFSLGHRSQRALRAGG